MCIANTKICNIYSGFLKILKIVDFVTNIFQKIKILVFGGQKLKILKIRDSHLKENVISVLLTFLFCDLLKNSMFYKPLNSAHFLA